MKVYVMPAPLSSQFDRNEQTLTVFDLSEKTRVVISGLNAGEINVPERVVSDVTMDTVDFKTYIEPNLPKQFKEFSN